VDVRIGIADSPQIIEVEMPDDTDRAELKNAVQAVLDGSAPVLTLEDKRGKELNVPSARVAFVEIGAGDDARRIGFGA
jgi:hypothetical protein